MKKSIFTLMFVFASILAVTQVQAEDKANRQPIVVTKIVDGDTIDATLLEKKKNVRIRLADIDCPETTKKSGNFQKQMRTWKISDEKELKERGKQAEKILGALITVYSEDIYFEETPEKVCRNEQRKVGVLWTGTGININEQMLQKAGCRPYKCSE